MADWLLADWQKVGLVLLSAPLVYATVIALTRVNGLRSFGKMSAFDFAMTVAVGTLLSSAIATQDPPVLQAMVALFALFGLQDVVARLRQSSQRIHALVDNRPLLLMRDGRMLHENMHEARITEADLRSQLRLANVVRITDVHAVVLESAGDLSVMHGTVRAEEFDAQLLDGVRGERSLRERASRA